MWQVWDKISVEEHTVRGHVLGNPVDNTVPSYCSQESLLPDAGVSIVKLIRLCAWIEFDQGQGPTESLQRIWVF